MSDKWLTLTPSYGRDYARAEDVLKAWNEKKDFTICDVSCRWNGSQINLDDAFNSERNTTFKIRFKKLQNFALIKLVDGVWTLIGKEDGAQDEAEDGSDGCTEEDYGVES